VLNLPAADVGPRQGVVALVALKPRRRERRTPTLTTHWLVSVREKSTPLIKLSERDLDADLRHAEDSIGIEKMSQPVATDTFEHCVNILRKNHVSLDGRRGAIIAILRDEIRARRTITQHLEYDHRIANDGNATLSRRSRAENKAVGITDLTVDLDF
jgi:hypothetical protein